MKIQELNIDGDKIIDLYHFADKIEDQVPLGSNIFADCDEVVDIDTLNGKYIAQIMLSSRPLTNVDDGFADDLLDGKISVKHGHVLITWDKFDASMRKPSKTYLAIIKAGKKAFNDYINSSYNHFRKHYRKVPEITTNQNDDFVNAHKLV